MDLSLLMGKAAIMEYFLEEGFEIVPRNENPSRYPFKSLNYELVTRNVDLYSCAGNLACRHCDPTNEV